MEIPETKRFIPEGFELGTTFSQPNRSIPGCNQFTMQISFATPNFNLELIKTSEVKTDFFYSSPLREYSKGHLVMPLNMTIKDLSF